MDTQQQKKFKILLVGDNCVDIYRYGTVDRISPEAPVPVFKFNYEESKPGMGGNVEVNLKQLGCDVKFITTDNPSIKTRLIDQRSKQHLLRLDEDNKAEPLTIKDLSFNEFDAVVISDYGKGFLSEDLIEQIINDSKLPVFIDTKFTDLERFQGAWVKINNLEYTKIKTECSGLIVTKGPDGASVIHHNIDITAPRVEVVDVTGAGDTFLSALAYEYLNTADIATAVRFAIQASSITVQHFGVYAPTLREIHESFSNRTQRIHR